MAVGHAYKPSAHGHVGNHNCTPFSTLPSACDKARDGCARHRHCNEYISVHIVATLDYLSAHVPLKDQEGPVLPRCGDLAQVEPVPQNFTSQQCDGLRLLVGI